MSKERRDHWEWFELVMEKVLEPEVVQEIIAAQDWQRAMYFLGTQLEIEQCTVAMLRHRLQQVEQQIN